MEMEEERINKMKKLLATPPPLPTSLSALPEEVTLNLLAHVSRFHLPTLSLVSKKLRSLIASPDLDAIRSHVGATENLLYVCLELKPNPPSWFILSPVPNQKLKPVNPSPFPYHQHPKSASFISIGTETYVIGGLVNEERTNKAFLLDCASHQWRTLPEMRVPRQAPAVDVIDGKIYVIGGCKSKNSDCWGEVFDPKTQIWKPLLPPKALEGKLVLSGKVYPMHSRRLAFGGKVYSMDRSMNFRLIKHICVVEIDDVLCQTSISDSTLIWYDPKEEDMKWSKVKGLERLFPSSYCPYYNLSSNTVSGGGRRLTAWWMLLRYENKKWIKEIWCAEISLERRSSRELWGFLEWSKKVFTIDGSDFDTDFILHSALMSL